MQISVGRISLKTTVTAVRTSPDRHHDSRPLMAVRADRSPFLADFIIFMHNYFCSKAISGEMIAIGLLHLQIILRPTEHSPHPGNPSFPSRANSLRLIGDTIGSSKGKCLTCILQAIV